MSGNFLPIQSPALTSNPDGIQRRQGSRQRESCRIRRGKAGRKEDRQSQGKERKGKGKGRRHKAMEKELMDRDGPHQPIVP